MAFVTCSQFKQSQEKQDEAIEELQNSAISAEDDLLDKSGKEGGGKITVEKIKEAIGGDVAVAVKANSGITGDGTAENPLALKTGDGITVDSKTGEIKLDVDKTAALVSSKTTIRLLDAFAQEDEVAYAFETQGGQ